MQNQSGMFAGDSYQLLWNYQQGIQRISRLMESLPMPILAVVEGAAVGAGCDLACMADMRLAGPKASFQESFARLNLVPGDGGTFFLPRVIGYARAMEMMLTAKVVDAEMAKSWGLVSEVHTQADLENAVNKTAQQICSLGAPALRLTKLAMKSLWSSQNLDRHLELLAAFQGLSQRMPEHQQLLNQMLAKR
jgi:enoyl-CoA hydratase/carnithine racemase